MIIDVLHHEIQYRPMIASVNDTRCSMKSLPKEELINRRKTVHVNDAQTIRGGANRLAHRHSKSERSICSASVAVVAGAASESDSKALDLWAVRMLRMLFASSNRLKSPNRP